MSPRREFSRTLALALVLGQALFSMPVFARGSNESQTARAERSQGTVAVNLGKYDEAVEHFSRAYSISQDPAVLFSLAQAYRLAGKGDKALATYSAFLRAAGGSAKYRAQMERAAEEIESLTSFLLNRPVDTRAPEKPAAVAETPASPAKPAAEQAIEPPALAEKKSATEAPAGLAAAKIEAPALLPKPEPAPSPAVDFTAERKEEAKPASQPVYKRWWFWTATAVVLAAGGTAAWWYTRPTNEAPASTYGALRVLP